MIYKTSATLNNKIQIINNYNKDMIFQQKINYSLYLNLKNNAK